jgi:putative endonuclease
VSYFVYILFSQSKDRYYIGYSHNCEERLIEHNLGATPSTRPGRPWIIAYKEEFPDKSSAIRRELEIKRMKSKKYIDNLIKNKSDGPDDTDR